MLKITYLSHSAFLLDDGKHQLVIDPFLTGNPNAPVEAAEIKAPFVVVTHGHGDHLGDGIHIAKTNKGIFIAVNELANYAASQGANAHNMHIGGAWNFPFGRIKFTIAHHGSAISDGRYMGEPAGVIISMGGKKIYHAGDTGLFMDMKLIGELEDIDICMLPIGGNFTMDIDDAVIAADMIKPKMLIPMHYNTFPVIQAAPEEFKEKAEKKGYECSVMDYGETLTF